MERAFESRLHVKVREFYGGLPAELMEGGRRLTDSGVNAVWIGAGGVDDGVIERLRAEDAAVFAEFDAMHDAAYLKQDREAAPVGRDGSPCPPPDDWQGICPTHPGYRRRRMESFRSLLTRYPIDGVWLDYHHSHASWEQAVPDMPDTCFCRRCLLQFAWDTGLELPAGSAAERATTLLGDRRARWTQWRCALFTDWLREFRAILDECRPGALLGTFHCPWSEDDFDGALRGKLAIDLRAQAEFLDVFSPMPYHARFGHADDPAWISRQTSWLGSYLGIRGVPGERLRIWPIVQLSDWGEHVPPEQVAPVLDHGTRLPATGVMGFNWGGLRGQMENAGKMEEFYRAIAPG